MRRGLHVAPHALEVKLLGAAERKFLEERDAVHYRDDGSVLVSGYERGARRPPTATRRRCGSQR